MPDLRSRSEWEARIARALGRLGQEHLKYLLDKMGDPPDPNKLSPRDWDEISSGLMRTMRPALEAIYLESAQALADSQPIGVDWALVNQRAADWAKQYVYDLVRGVTGNTRAALQKKVEAYFLAPATIGDLKKSLQSLFGVVRADSISITEVTRAAAQGELGAIREIEKHGIKMIATWHTSNDETVCRICKPRNRKKQGDGWFDLPPAHPRCRCAVGWSPVEIA